MIFGSHLYGTSSETSDTDYKAVFMPSVREICLGQIPRTRPIKTTDNTRRNTSHDVDEDHYSLHYFVALALKGETAALDMLHAPKSALLVTSPTWEYLQAHRDRFYTRQLYGLVGYARKQAAKYGIKGSRIAAAKQVVALLETKEPQQKLHEFWGDLPLNEHNKMVTTDVDHLYSVCGKRFHDTVKVKHVLPILQDFLLRYGARARAAERSEGVDWKALSHAIRAAHQVLHIFRDGGFTYPLAQTPLLIKVKNGQIPYPEVAAYLDGLMIEVEEAAKHSTLPQNPDQEAWEDWLCEETQKVGLALNGVV